MTLWAFLLPLVYVPGWTGWVLQTGWAYICLTVPLLLWFRQGHLPRWTIVLGALAFGSALFSLTRLPAPIWGLEQIMQVFAIGLCFWLGSTLENLKPIAVGMALGVLPSVVLTASQWLGWDFGVVGFTRPAGLFFNSISLGDTCAVLSLLVSDGKLLAPLLLGLILSFSRGSALALASGTILHAAQRDRRWLFALTLPAVALGYWFFWRGESDHFRLLVWSNVLSHWSLLGHGIGILQDTALREGPRVFQVQYAHNEFLDTFHSFGLLAGFWWILLLAPLGQWRSHAWPAYCCWLATAVWSFPLHHAVEAALGALLAGHLLRDRLVLWDHLDPWRRSFLRWLSDRQALPDRGWWGPSPIRKTNPL